MERQGDIVAITFLFDGGIARFYDAQFRAVTFVTHFLRIGGRDGNAVVAVRGSGGKFEADQFRVL